jgi:ABC-2 type transport system ATP-binding protein
LLSEIGEQTVVILSTHIVEDVTNLCTSMAIVNKGNLVLEGTPAKALETVAGKIWAKHVDKKEIPVIQAQYNVLTTKLVGGKPTAFIFSDGEPGDGFLPSEGGLEEVYFYAISA